MKRIPTILFCFIFPIVLFAQQTVTIDVKANVKPISPLIYGANNSTTNATAIRWGGNRTSTYNWENNNSNAGKDYNNISDAYFLQGISSDEIAIPAIPIIKMVTNAKNNNQYALVTLQAAGFVAHDGNGAVTTAQIAPSSRWDSVVFRKGSAFSLTPDKTDGKVYIDEYVNYLTKKLGSTGNGGVDAYAVDNEPFLWGTTHPLIRPKSLTLDELFYKTIEVASIVKEINPHAEVYGPMFYGWWDAFRMDNIYGWSAAQTKNKYYWGVDYYLDSLQKLDTQTGKRLIDVLSIHWYPEAIGATTRLRIVDMAKTYTEAQLNAPDMVTARLQAPRSLWDDTYREISAIGETHIMLIKRLQNSINTYYPGTKLAFTEFKYDAENHFSGGLALADVLGIFGREGVYMASKWDGISNYALSAYNLYLNYDNKGNKFGNTSVQATTDNNANLSTVASLDENNNLHIIVINKTENSINTDFSISNGIYSHGKVFGFGQASMSIQTLTPIDTVLNSTFDYSIPAYSAVHIVLYSMPRVALQNAQIIEGSPSEIKLQFNSNITINDALLAKNEFKVYNNEGVELEISNVTQLVNAKQIIIQLAVPLTQNDTICKLSYLGVNIVDSINIPINDINYQQINNEFLNAPWTIISGTVKNTGKIIELTFTKKIDTSDLSNTGLSVLKNNISISLDSIVKTLDSEYKLLLYPTTRILKYDTIIITNNNNLLFAIDGSNCSFFSIQALNNGPNYSPVIDSIVIQDNYSINAYLNYQIKISDLLNAGFELLENGVEIPYKLNYHENIITFSTENPMLFENIYTLNYNDNSIVETLFGGYLNSFKNEIAQNQLLPLKPAVIIPDTLQAEDAAFYRGDFILETCGDINGGFHVGFIAPNDIFGYRIQVNEENIYTLTIRHSGSSSNGLVSIYIDDVLSAKIFIPMTSSWQIWKSSSVALNLPAGEHVIELRVDKIGFNLNWASIELGNHPSDAEITTAFTSKTGNLIYLFYDRQLQIKPLFDEISISSDNINKKITSIDYFNNDSTKLAITIDEPIIKDENITINYSITSARTTENGIIAPVSNKIIQNKSTLIRDEINNIKNSNISIFPIPAKENQAIYITSKNKNECEYTISSLSGNIIEQGRFIENKTIKIPNKGLYIIRVQENTNNISKKILIK